MFKCPWQSGSGILAKAKAQIARRAEEEAAADREDADEEGNGEHIIVVRDHS